MGLLVRHSAGRRSCSRKKMLGLFLWFLFSEMFRDVFSAAVFASIENSNIPPGSSKEINKNITSEKNNAESSVNADLNSNSFLRRVSKALPQEINTYENLADVMLQIDKNTEDVQKAPTKLKTLFLIPYLRPGRSGINKEIKGVSEVPNTMIPIVRFGKSVSNSVNENFKFENNNDMFKPYDSSLLSFNFHANDDKNHIITTSNVLDQNVMDSLNGEDGTNFSVQESISNDYFYDSKYRDNNYDFSHFEDSVHSAVRQKREISDHNTVIPYPRAGRTTAQNSKDENVKEESKQPIFDILSTMQNSRTMDFFGSPTVYENEKPNPSSYVLPYPRPGRSKNYNNEIEASESLLDSQSNSILKLYDEKIDREEVEEMEQQPGPLSQSFIKNSFQREERIPHLKDISQKSKEPPDDSTVFIIPYPRPGKKSMLVISSPRIKQKSDKEGEVLNDYVLPYPRPGKKSLPRLPVKSSKTNDNENENSHNYILPYPRPGRSELDDVNDDLSHEINEKNASVFNRFNLSKVLNSKESTLYEGNKDTNLKIPDIESLKSEIDHTDLFTDNSFRFVYKRSNVIPYPRLGRSMSVLSYPGRNYVISIPRLKRSNSIISHLNEERSNSVPPYIRLRKSESILPYPRVGKSNSVVPYPRLGRSESVEPYPKVVPSNTIVPFPRPGRSDSVVPYPRPGRSNSVVPYPRPGRSDSVVPYPRLGRSDSVVPYPRLGRTSSIVPYPRLGRSNSLVPYPRPGRSDSVVPYPRLGRSDSAISYPRSRRSDSVVPYPRPGRSDSVVPYPRLGRSNFMVLYPRLRRSNSVVPYPRLGRTDSVVPYPRPGRSDFVVPYPRIGRSDAVVPYPRLGRSDSAIPYPRPGRSNSVVPYPRTGRSNSAVSYPRLNHTKSVVPYPRLGRSTSVNPYINSDRSLALDFHQRKNLSGKPIVPLQNNDKTGKWILPNIRPGRSESEREIVFLPNSKTDRTENAQNLDSALKEGIRRDTLVPYPRLSEEEIEEYIWPEAESLVYNERTLTTRNTADADTIIPYPRLGRSEEQVTPSPDLINTAHKLNKHMLSRVDDSIYLLPYPRPGRMSF